VPPSTCGECTSSILVVRRVRVSPNRRVDDSTKWQPRKYASVEYQRLLAAHGIASSMSRPGDCWDNAVAESFFATLKADLVRDAHWATRALAHAALGEYIEIWYNQQRRHSALGYRSPVQYEREVLIRAAA
jgi:putative transposase